MSFARRHLTKLVLSIILALLFVWLLNRGALPFWPDEQALAKANPMALPAYLGLWSLVHVVRAARWQFLLAPLARVPMRKVIGVSFIGFAAVVLMPMRTGEVVRPALLRKKGELSGWSVMGTIAAERIIDGLLLSLILLVGLMLSDPISPLPNRIGDLDVSPSVVPTAAYVALAIFGTAFATMAAFFYARDLARSLVSVPLNWVSPRLSSFVTSRIEKVTDGLGFLPRPGLTISFVAVTAGYWFLNALASLVLAHAVGLQELTYAQCCVLTGVLALGIMVPNAPGFFGAFQFSIYAALALYIVDRELLGPGSVLVFYLYVGQMVVTFLGAVVGMVMLRTSFATALASSDSDLVD